MHIIQHWLSLKGTVGSSQGAYSLHIFAGVYSSLKKDGVKRSSQDKQLQCTQYGAIKPLLT